MPKRLRTDRALYLDLELTCWEGGVPPEGQYNGEIIQIGLVEVDTINLAITRKAAYYVKPIGNSKVSDYCASLTGITQRHVDRQGRLFWEVQSSIEKKFGPLGKVCYTWGNDQEAWERSCDDCGACSVFHFVNLSHLFSIQMGLKKSVGLVDAIEMMNSSFVGWQHDALVDAENTAELHMAMMRRMRA